MSLSATYGPATQNNATDAMGDSLQLNFSKSAHEPLSVVQDNAPIIVGAMRLGAALLPVAAGAFGWEDPEQLSEALPFLSVHGAGLVGSELVLLANGNREKRLEVAREYADAPDDPDWKKPFNPRRYPLESSAALDVAGEAALVLGGALIMFGIMPDWLEGFLGLHEHGAEIAEAVSEGAADCVEHAPSFAPQPSYLPDVPHDHVHCDAVAQAAVDAEPHAHEHNHLLAGLAILGHGAVGMAAHLPIIFGKERSKVGTALSEHSGKAESNKEELCFAKSQSQRVGIIGRAIEEVKDNPVAIASAIQAAVGISLMIAFPASWSMMASGAIIAASAVLQGLFVRKNVENEIPTSQIKEPQLDDILNKQPAGLAHA